MSKDTDIWASKTEWRRRGYALRGGGDTPSISRTHVTAGSGWVTYDAYHAFQVRPLPKVWSQVVGVLPPSWHHLRREEPDRATACAVHDLLLEHGQDEAAGRLRWAVLGAEERFRADLAAHEAMVRAKEEKARAKEEARKRREPATRRREARHLARRAAEQTATGIEQELCLIPVGLDWQDRPTLLAYLRDRGKADLADQLAGGHPVELRVRPCFDRKNRLVLSRVERTYRGLSAQEWERIATGKRPVPDRIVELLLGPAASPAGAPPG